MAIPYVKTTYGSEFSILKLNSIILILHLSLCDLLYALVGLPHLIHAYFTQTNIYSDTVCYLLGMLRNLIAYTDFNTIAVISCCVARQTLCRWGLLSLGVYSCKSREGNGRKLSFFSRDF